MPVAIGTSLAIPFRKRMGQAIPNKTECLQSVMNKAPVYNGTTGFWEWEDKIGKVDKAPLNGNVYNFDGDDDYVNLGSKHLLMPNGSTDKFTLKLRFKADDVSPLSTIIGKYNTGDNEREWLLWIIGSKVSFIMPNTDNYSNRIGKASNNNIVAGEWYDVEIHYDGSETEAGITFLLNGVEQTVSDSAGTYSGLTQGNANIMIGGYFNSGTFERGFDGIVSDVKFFNADEKLVHAWHCDETGGTTCYDSIETWYGDDMAQDPDFDSSSAWTKQTSANISIAGGKATWTGSSYIYETTIQKINPGRYKLTVDAETIVGTVRFYFGSTTNGYIDISESGVHYLDTTRDDNNRLFIIGGAGDILNSVTYQFLHEPANGKLENITPSAFFAEDARFKSYQNEIGYSGNSIYNGSSSRLDFDKDITFNDTDSWRIDFSTEKNTTSFDKGMFIGEADTTNNYIMLISSADDRVTFRNTTSYNLFSGLNEEFLIRHNYSLVADGNGRLALELDGEEVDFLTGVPTNFVLNNLGRSYNSTSHYYEGEINYLKVTKNGAVVCDINFTNLTDKEGNITISNTNVATALIPVALDENDEGTELDIFGDEPTYLGLTKNNLKAVNNSCLEFDGSNYVNIPSDPGMSGNKITVTFRINPSTVTNNDRVITKGITSNGNWMISFGAGTLRVYSKDSDGVFKDTGAFGSAVPTGEWNTYKVIIDAVAGTTTLYKKDSAGTFQQDAQTTGTNYTGTFTNTVDLKIGAIGTSGTYDGLFDYVILETPDKTYTYNFGEGSGVTVYDRTPTAYGDDINQDFDFTTWTESGASEVTEKAITADGSTHAFVRKHLAGSAKEWRIVAKGVSTVASSRAKICDFDRSAIDIPISNGNFDIDTTVQMVAGDEPIGINISIGYSGKITFDVFTIQEVFKPINGTLEDSPTWTTDEKASPSNLTTGFSQGFSQKYTAGLVNFGQQELGTEFTMYGIVNLPSNLTSARLFGAEPDTTGTTTKCYPYILATNGTVGFYGMGLDTSFTSSPVITGEGIKELMFTFTATTVTLFVDGEEISSLSITNAGFSGELTAFDRSTGNRTFLGDMFDIKFASGVKTVEEMRALQQNNTYTYEGTNPPKLLRLPSQTGETGLDIFGNTLSNPSGKFHNNAETKLEEYPVPTLYKADALLTTSVLYNHTTQEPLEIPYEDMVYDFGDEHIIFMNAEEIKKRNMLVYSEEQTGDNLTKINKFIKKPI